MVAACVKGGRKTYQQGGRKVSHLGYYVTNAEARSFQAGAAREMENFYARLADLVKGKREENRKML
jgi:hypothetical protein